MITIRIALNTDIEEIQSLYRNTVLVINRRDYSQAEVEDWAIEKAMGLLEDYEKVVDALTKRQRTTEVLDRMQRQEDGHNKNPFRQLLNRLMRNEGGYSTTEIGQLKYALDGFYGSDRDPAESVPAPHSEPWYGHQFKEVRRGYWQCSCEKAIAEAVPSASLSARLRTL
jgi:hypothetical protein